MSLPRPRQRPVQEVDRRIVSIFALTAVSVAITPLPHSQHPPRERGMTVPADAVEENK